MTDAFQRFTDEYEAWFDRHDETYQAELAALEALRPDGDRSLSVGVGTGRFAAPLGIEYGVDPSAEMLEHALARGIEGVLGVGESLPFCTDCFDTLLIVTTVCFFEDLDRALSEAYRVLEPGGSILVGFIDRASPVGQQYEASKAENPFYREATFYTTEEIEGAIRAAGFDAIERRQTVFTDPETMVDPDPVKHGTGEGSFVALRARA
ncbi:MAG: class I SAM-dependent methyltransferase [Halodesulfurarchaeum sp.]